MRKISVMRVRITMFIVMATLTPQLLAAPKPLRSSNPIAPEDCEGLCNGWKKIKEDRRVVIDPNTGEVIDGQTRFNDDEPVQIIFVNKNPFKYKYDFQIRTEPLSLGNVLTFLNLLPNVFPPSVIPQPSGQGAAPSTRQVCLDLPVVKLLITRGTELATVKGEKIRNDLNAKVELLPKAQETYNQLQKETQDDKINCVAVCKIADKFSTQASQLDVTQVENDLTAFKQEVADYKKRVEGLTLPDNPGCEAEVKVYLRALYVAALNNAMTTFDSTLTAYKEAYGKVKANFDAVKAVYDDPNAFYEVTRSGRIGEAALVQIRIYRTERRVANAKPVLAKEIELVVGESPIVLSAGIGFSTIDEVKIIRESTQKPDGTLATRFGRQLNSNFKATGVVMLNTRLKRFHSTVNSLGVGVGLGMNNRNDSTSFEFIAGPSLGFVNNKFFFTVGFSAARVERLSGGFKEGDIVPPNLPDPLPVQKNFQMGAMFAFTYKIR